MVTYDVTPNSKLDGTNANEIHMSCRRQPMASEVEAALARIESLIVAADRRGSAHIPTRTIKRTYDAVQSRLCAAWLSEGSSRNGNASSASRLPKLLAAYRKYGSFASQLLLLANQA